MRKAVAAVIEEGTVRSYDMKKLPGGGDAISKGAATTTAITDAILARLG
jgi:3-isopropylmalate dehydrogenase